jgi:hypothetical protein
VDHLLYFCFLVFLHRYLVRLATHSRYPLQYAFSVGFRFGGGSGWEHPWNGVWSGCPG